MVWHGGYIYLWQPSINDYIQIQKPGHYLVYAHNMTRFQCLLPSSWKRFEPYTCYSNSYNIKPLFQKADSLVDRIIPKLFKGMNRCSTVVYEKKLTIRILCQWNWMTGHPLIPSLTRVLSSDNLSDNYDSWVRSSQWGDESVACRVTLFQHASNGILPAHINLPDVYIHCAF